MKDDFEVVVSGGSYSRKLGEHGSLSFQGVRCPKCRHVFMPVVSNSVACPECGFTKVYNPQTAAFEWSNQPSEVRGEH
jgi:ssDNA-binding Zn-finger/Zn-ribbon topoisomerase 1